MFVKMVENVRSRLSGCARFVCDQVIVPLALFIKPLQAVG
jgi:hypothetical protein